MRLGNVDAALMECMTRIECEVQRVHYSCKVGSYWIHSRWVANAENQQQCTRKSFQWSHVYVWDFLT